MILSDTTIRYRLGFDEGPPTDPRQTLLIEPLDDPELQIQPASVDLRLGNSFKRFVGPYPPLPDGQVHILPHGHKPEALPLRTHWDKHMEDHEDRYRFELASGEFALGTTHERVKLPTDLVGRVEGRSSLGRIGLLVHATAGFIDPGFEGHITLELYNLNPHPLLLEPGTRICQISFHQMSSPAARPYGSERGSKYQGQSSVTGSRMHADLRGGRDEG